MKLTQEHSFPDEEITSWQHEGDVLTIEVSGVHYAGQVHDQAKIVFADIQRMTCMIYHSDQGIWQELGDVEPLKDICELHLKLDKHYSLKGFGAESGQWIEIGIVSQKGNIEW